MIIMSFPHVNGYEIVEKVGVGSFSVVYKAVTKVITDKIRIIKKYTLMKFLDTIEGNRCNKMCRETLPEEIVCR